MCRYFNYNVSLQERLLHDQVYCFVLVSLSLWLCIVKTQKKQTEALAEKSCMKAKLTGQFIAKSKIRIFPRTINPSRNSTVMSLYRNCDKLIHRPHCGSFM